MSKAVNESKFIGCSKNVTQDNKTYYNVTLMNDGEVINFGCNESTYDYAKALEFGTDVLAEFILGSFSNRATIRLGRIQIKK